MVRQGKGLKKGAAAFACFKQIKRDSYALNHISLSANTKKPLSGSYLLAYAFPHRPWLYTFKIFSSATISSAFS